MKDITLDHGPEHSYFPAIKTLSDYQFFYCQADDKFERSNVGCNLLKRYFVIALLYQTGSHLMR